MNAPHPTRRGVPPRHARRRAIAAGSVLLAAIAIYLASHRSDAADRMPVAGSSKSTAGPTGTDSARAAAALVAVPIAKLPEPERDAAAASDGARVFVLAGLNSADVSTAAVVEISRRTARTKAPLPLALHDAAAAALGGSVYLFGGANQAPSDAVIKVGSGSSRKTVARLPAAVSDVAAATVGNTAYVVGGYDGAAAVSTITAWRPGRVPKTVGHLPSPARYVAVAPLNGKLVIVGGTVGGSASRSILLFDPATGKLARAGRLSNAVTHAAAAAIGSTVYVIGGRGSALNAQTARVTAITVDAAGAAHSVRAGRIPRALSDLQAVRLGGEIVVTGGLDSQNAAQSDVLALHPSGRP